MNFQKVLKGISGLNRTDAKTMVSETGIQCNWWRAKNLISPVEVRDQLTDSNLLHHLNDYDKTLPVGHPYGNLGTTYGDVTPFISTTAGNVQRDEEKRANILFPPFITALHFATEGYTTKGYIFYAYVNTLSKKAMPLMHIAEEVRELNIYQQYLPYHREGEIAAKIHIPVVNIEKAEEYDGPTALSALASGRLPIPNLIIGNPYYQSPEKFSNVHDLL